MNKFGGKFLILSKHASENNKKKNIQIHLLDMETCSVYDYNSLPISANPSLNNFAIKKMMSDEYLSNSIYNSSDNPLYILGSKNIYKINKIDLKELSLDLYSN